MPEESGEVTAEQLLAAATQYDAALEAGEEPSMVIESPDGDEYPAVEETEAEVEPEESPPEPEADSTDKEPESSLTEEEEAQAPSPQEKKSKYAKNRERLNKTWAEANEVKEQNKRDRQAINQATRNWNSSDNKSLPPTDTAMSMVIPPRTTRKPRKVSGMKAKQSWLKPLTGRLMNFPRSRIKQWRKAVNNRAHRFLKPNARS